MLDKRDQLFNDDFGKGSNGIHNDYIVRVPKFPYQQCSIGGLG